MRRVSEGILVKRAYTADRDVRACRSTRVAVCGTWWPHDIIDDLRKVDFTCDTFNKGINESRRDLVVDIFAKKGARI